jgi:hypothetical protein
MRFFVNLLLQSASARDTVAASADMHFLLHLYAQHAALLKTVSGFIATLFAVAKFVPGPVSKWRRRKLGKLLGARKYTPEQVRNATAFYIEPECQNIDPAGAEDWRRIYPLRTRLFKTIDNLLTNQAEFRHTILLADSAMGKTCFLLNYFARHSRRLRPSFHVAIVPLALGAEDSDTFIKEIPNKDSTVIFLDAFDEDMRAIQDHQERLKQLLTLTADFRHVLITCRTQFFLQDDEIPKDVPGLIRFAPTSTSKHYTFYKLYLTPFHDPQITRYLRKRYPLWQLKKRRMARALASRIGDLTARPLVLSYIDDLLNSGRDFKYSFEVYEEIVNRWIKRERPFVENATALWQFSEVVAEDIFANREVREAEIIPYDKIDPLAKGFGIYLERWQLTGRSLLNRTADGRFKYAHRSILEYVLVRGFVAKRVSLKPPWTDQMVDFFWQMVHHSSDNSGQRLSADLMDSARLSQLSYFLWALRTNQTKIPFAAISECRRLGFVLPANVEMEIFDHGNGLTLWVYKPYKPGLSPMLVDSGVDSFIEIFPLEARVRSVELEGKMKEETITTIRPNLSFSASMVLGLRSMDQDNRLTASVLKKLGDSRLSELVYYLLSLSTFWLGDPVSWPPKRPISLDVKTIIREATIGKQEQE